MEDTRILTIFEARELMPDTTASLSDAEVEQIVTNLELLAEAYVRAVQFDDDFIVNIAYNRGSNLG